MMGNSLGLTALLSAIAVAGALAVGCSARRLDDGVVKVGLQLSPRFAINTIHWHIDSPTTMDVERGDIDTSDINTAVSLDTSCPAGNGYRIFMTASATDTTTGRTVSCAGSTPAPGFDVTAAESVTVDLALVCGGSGGYVTFALVLNKMFRVDTVHWQIDSPTTTDVEDGDVDTSDINSTPSVDTSCPVGSGYRVFMTATATDTTSGNTVPCTGSSPAPGFNVTAGSSVMVGVNLICGGSMLPPTSGGHVVVAGTFVAGDNCPVLTSWTVSPFETTVGQQIDVSATATDADLPLQTLSYMWIPDSGSFLAPMSATTEYVCGAPTLDATGTRLAPPHTLTLTVSDSYTPPCSTSVFFSVDCRQMSVCGNGIIEPGEECDPPTPDGTCDATCMAHGA